MSWYGVYHDGTVVTTPVSFLIRFYTDASGPDTIYSQQSVSVSATATGLENSAGYQILAYTASLANVSIGAGSSWISILENDPSVATIWTWQFSDVGQNNVAFRDGESDSYTTDTPDNTAFTISYTTVPEPSSLLLSGVGLASIGLGMRRRNRSRS